MIHDHENQRRAAITSIFEEACQSDEPLTVLSNRCAELRGDPDWCGPEVDKVGNAVLRLLSIHLKTVLIPPNNALGKSAFGQYQGLIPGISLLTIRGWKRQPPPAPAGRSNWQSYSTIDLSSSPRSNERRHLQHRRKRPVGIWFAASLTPSFRGCRGWSGTGRRGGTKVALPEHRRLW